MLDITDTAFQKLRDIMHKRTGVYLKETKKPLLVTRLRKRLEELNLKSYDQYIALLSQPNTSEMEFFINAVTTNETYFFRHTKQFNYLLDTILPELHSRKRSATIWSAACSTGEEPYSLAIACHEFYKKNRNFTAKIHATDINSDVVSFSKEGLYPERSLRETPPSIQKLYFVPVETEGKIKKTFFKIDDTIKKKVQFGTHNLLEPFRHGAIDVVFLRNVMIYFQSDVKQKVVSLIYDKVVSGGYLFISLSESLNDVKSGFRFIQSGIYQKNE
jgi:chemotaxis protein methyltransferase CheR